MQLKTCPFCGGDPYLEESSRGYVNGKSTKVCYVRCKRCNARSERVNIQDYGHTCRSWDAVQRVAEQWNNRVNNAFIVEFTTNFEKNRPSEA